ncbi:hypothetical protein CAOG_009910 [Capsaspora owczarzaki ATCC 30864]|uniref:Gamma-secretase-activating protein C-terminal domain-containing protein n=1 Tax=Capsaspora owczarzaki (strain ATCC 30864) TaxID=595528 RepID=A0A0D2UJL7_CAPO3|nr:hypothetical protein CAOG_009910 [Capsaspora owczarzaki ATCC 30864]
MFDCSRGIAYRFELDWDTVFDLFALSESPQLHMKAMHLVIAHMADTRPVKLLVDRLCAELPHRITPELLKEFLIGATHHMYMSREGADAALLRLLPMTTIPALVDEWGDEGATTRSTFTQEYAGLGFHYRTLKNVALGIKKESELSKKQSSMVGVGSSFEALRLLCLNSKQRRFSVERRLRRETSHVSSSSLFGSAPNSPASNNSGSANSQQPASPASVALQGGSSLSSSLVSAVTSFAHLSAAGNPGNNPANSPASSMRRFFARMFTPVAAVPDAVGSPTTEAMKDRGLLNSPREAHSKMASSAKDYTDVQQLQASQLFRLIVEARTEAFSPATPLSASSSSDPTPDARSPSFAHLDSELASLSQSVSEHEALRSVETQDNDQITFELLEMLYCALEELEFPFPNNFIAKFGRLAYKCLDRFTFLQYVSRRTFVLTPDFVREILSTIAPNVGQYEIPSSPAPSDPSSPPALFPPASAAPSTLASREDADFAFRLISRLDPAPALKLLTEWKHPLATQYVTNLYSQSILSSQQLHADSSRSSFQPQGNNRASMQFGGDGFPGADGAPRPRHERTAEGNIIFLPSDYDPEVGMYNDGIANIDEAGGVDLGEAANDAFPIFRFIPLQLFLRQLARKDAMDGGDGSELRFVYEATRCLADVPRVVPSLAEHPDMLAAFADDGWRTATASTGRNSDDSEPNVTERQLRQRHIKQVQQQLLDELGASWCDKDDPSWIETQLLRESYLAISRTTSDASRLRAAQQ